MQGEGNHQKKTSSLLSATNPPSRRRSKGHTSPRTPWKRTLTKKKPRRKTHLFPPLNGTGNDMNSCKVMLAQAKAMKSTWLDACGGGAVRVRFKDAKKRPAEVEELNAIFSNAVKAVLTKNTRKSSRPRVTPTQKTSRITSNFKPSRLGVNDKHPALR